jgi:hypothetical protein
MATSHRLMGHASKYLVACLASGVLAAPAQAQRPVAWSQSWQTASPQQAQQGRQWWSQPAVGGHQAVEATLGQRGSQDASAPRRSRLSGYFRRSSEASQAVASQASQPQRVSAAPPGIRHTVASGGAARVGAFSGLRRFFSRSHEPAPQAVSPQPVGPVIEGTASWYGSDFHGGPTASGERYDMYSYTAAHRTLPFGTLVKVTNLRNGRDVIVRINNRGPYIKGRILDLSKGAAAQIGMVSSGLARVRMEIIGRDG